MRVEEKLFGSLVCQIALQLNLGSSRTELEADIVKPSALHCTSLSRCSIRCPMGSAVLYRTSRFRDKSFGSKAGFRRPAIDKFESHARISLSRSF